MVPKWMMTAVTALVMTAAFVACSRGDRSPREKVTLAISATSDSVLAQVAQDRGFYKDEGLELTAHLQPYGKLALQEVLEGKADLATVAETPVMFAILNGAKISILATIQSSRKGTAIVARKDRGVLSLSDLKGKRIAVTRGTTSDYFLDALLAGNGIARSAVKVVDMKAEEMPDALANGLVDAVSTFKTYAIPARNKLGERGILFQDENVYTTTFNIVASQEFISTNPGRVRKLLRALVKAEAFVKEHPVEAQKIVARFSSVDIAMVREIWNETSFHVSLDQELMLALEDESGWAIKNRHTGAATVPNYLNYIQLDGLKAVNPDAVRIMR